MTLVAAALVATATASVSLTPTGAALYARLVGVTAYAAEQTARLKAAERERDRERAARRACEESAPPAPEWVWPVVGGSVGAAVAGVAAVVLVVTR